jgi:hypothetical protein
MKMNEAEDMKEERKDNVKIVKIGFKCGPLTASRAALPI